MPQGGFSPLRLEGWRIRRDLPGTSFSLSLLPAYTARRPVCLRPSCFSVDPPKVGSVDAMYCTAMRWNSPPTPGALAPSRVMLSRPLLTYSAPSVPLAGTSRLHRRAAYTRCLRCACPPRRPTSGSGLLLHIPSWHAILYDPGDFDIHKFQSRDVDIGLRRLLNGSALPKIPQLRFTRDTQCRGFLVYSFATACQVARRPARI